MEHKLLALEKTVLFHVKKLKSGFQKDQKEINTPAIQFFELYFYRHTFQGKQKFQDNRVQHSK